MFRYRFYLLYLTYGSSDLRPNCLDSRVRVLTCISPSKMVTIGSVTVIFLQKSEDNITLSLYYYPYTSGIMRVKIVDLSTGAKKRNILTSS